MVAALEKNAQNMTLRETDQVDTCEYCNVLLLWYSGRSRSRANDQFNVRSPIDSTNKMIVGCFNSAGYKIAAFKIHTRL